MTEEHAASTTAVTAETAGQTLYIGDWCSVCGHCGQNADPHEKRHMMERMEGSGCGVEWRYVTSDVGNDFARTMRPDLTWLQPDGRRFTSFMEERLISGMPVIGPLPGESTTPQ